MEFIYFLGRFHVLVLHLPIGIIVALLIMEWLVRKEKFQHLESAAGFLWMAGAVSAIATVALGYMHFAEGGFDGASGYQHRNFGTGAAVIITVVALLRSSTFAKNYRPVFLPAAALLFVLISMVGHYGGNLTHGSTYLIEYAPTPVRMVFGLGPRRPPVTDLAQADPYLDIVAPMLDSRCEGCHNPDQRQAELDVTTYETLMRGGETGRVITAGRPEVSELIHRITLPEDDEAFMPAEGRTPLTARQVEIIRWWIGTGATTGTPLGQIDGALDAEITTLLNAELGLDGS
ncbi:MAG: hypothetical protein PVF63_09360 [Gammaproteobacteria bacterium]|jgi:uncharacterized membrane protein